MTRASLSRRAAWASVLVTVAGLGPLTFPAPVAAATPTPGSWSESGDMTRARGFAPVVALADGTVITAGGTDGSSFSASAERWSSGTWTTAGSIGQPVAGQVAVKLNNGKALFAGGADDISYYLKADVFDPSAGTWAQTPNMVHAHAYGAAAKLANGDVLVIGGYDGGPSLVTNAVDVYSAGGGTWSAGSALPGAGRYAFTATAAGNGKILVAGGSDGSLGASAALSSAYVYTAGSGWAATDSMSRPRIDAASVTLPDGRILVAGGVDGNGVPTNTAEVYDPTTGHWSLTGFMPLARAGFSLTLMTGGKVLAAGGYGTSPSQAMSTAVLFDPTTGGWSSTGSFLFARRFPSAAALPDGRVLVTGGHDGGTSYLDSTELYNPPPPPITYPAMTFHPLDPARILDTRSGIGISGVFYSHVPRKFPVIGHGGVPAEAKAITGILTTTQSTAGGYFTLGPVFTASSLFSTLNFPKGDNRANNVAVALDAQGYLSLLYVGGTGGKTNAIFDVTGYFTADDTGATYYPIAQPQRLLDTRLAGQGGRFLTGVPRTIPVVGVSPANVPSSAIAVTGNLTLVNPSTQGWAFVGPSIANPATLNTSMINSVAGDTRADGVTVKLNGSDGSLTAIWMGPAGSSSDVLFDITGYYVQGLGGARFVPLEPIRLVDTRANMPFMGPIVRLAPATIHIDGRAGIAPDAVAVSGNLTVTAQSASGYLAIAPQLAAGVQAPISTINFPKGDNRANGFFVSVYTDGSLAVLYGNGVSGSTTHFIMDMTGYFQAPPG
jgi:N-acetylneuraminic acid mutarotase